MQAQAAPVHKLYHLDHSDDHQNLCDDHPTHHDDHQNCCDDCQTPLIIIKTLLVITGHQGYDQHNP